MTKCEVKKQAPVQGSSVYFRANNRSLKQMKPPGAVSWEEYLEAWKVYDKKWHSNQSAERIARRGGFGYEELVELLGHDPKTWIPR